MSTPVMAFTMLGREAMMSSTSPVSLSGEEEKEGGEVKEEEKEEFG